MGFVCMKTGFSSPVFIYYFNFFLYHFCSLCVLNLVVVCMFTDSLHTFVGRSGDYDPVVTIPTVKVAEFYVDGVIRTWTVARAIWRASLTSVEVKPDQPRGMAFILPSHITLADIRRAVELMFAELPISSLLITHVWIPVLLAHNMSSGIVVHVGHTDCVVVSIVRYSTSPEYIVRLQFGVKESRARITSIVEVSDLSIQPYSSAYAKPSITSLPAFGSPICDCIVFRHACFISLLSSIGNCKSDRGACQAFSCHFVQLRRCEW
jgi:hypothetical protein